MTTKYTNKHSLKYKPSVIKSILLNKIEKCENECWEFTGFVNIKGYGTFRHKTLSISAHRLSYIVFKGSIKPDLYVLHKCDNRRCINPDHLFTGTQADNMRDMVLKGRSAKLDRVGELNPNSKLTNKERSYICKNYPELGSAVLVKRFGVSRTQIHRIIKSWGDK